MNGGSIGSNPPPAKGRLTGLAWLVGRFLSAYRARQGRPAFGPFWQGGQSWQRLRDPGGDSLEGLILKKAVLAQAGGCGGSLIFKELGPPGAGVAGIGSKV